MNLTKEERVLRIINRQQVDYLPSQIVFADRSRYADISKAFGLKSEEELDEYLENHFYMTFDLHDKPMFFRDDRKEIERLKVSGYANPDWENNVVYNDWGVGYKVGVDSVFASFHPLQGKTTDHILKFMPERIKEAVMEKDVEVAIKKYTPPDPNKAGNFEEWENDFKKYSGNFLVWPSGYGGVYERSSSLLGWEEFMTYIALKPEIIEELFDKVADFKTALAKKVVEIGFKIGHFGEDLGTQTSGFFSDKMFKSLLLPRLARIFEVYKNAGVPVMMHSCGNILQYIPQLIDIGLDILEPTQPCMDLKYLKKEFGKDLIFYGGINTQTLPYLAEGQVREMVRDTIRILGKGGGYIIAPSQEIMNDVPVANIKVLVETIKEERGTFY